LDAVGAASDYPQGSGDLSKENVAFPYGLETSRDLHNNVV
jgi:hypothetical protein